MKDKLKEKIPGVGGGGGNEQSHNTATTTTTASAPGAPHQTGEKKGFMEKIKEKLPGVHHSH